MLLDETARSNTRAGDDFFCTTRVLDRRRRDLTPAGHDHVTTADSATTSSA
jgi:hypothetical protein